MPLPRMCKVISVLFCAIFVSFAVAQEVPPLDNGQSAAEQRAMEVIGELGKLQAAITDNRFALMRERPHDYALGQLKLEKAQIILQQPFRTDDLDELLVRDLEQALAIWTSLIDGKPLDLPTQGKIERAYLAPSDRSPQPYILFVPPDYDGSEPYGLLLFLHGYVSTLNKATWGEVMYTDAMAELATRTRSILCLPYGRGNTDFQGIGEDDVLAVTRRVETEFNVDSSRRFLAGISMGGMGVWSIGAHNPHLWAGLVVLAGRSDFYMWKGIERDSLPAYRRKLVRAEFGAELLPAYRNLPSVLVHGTLDWTMPIEQTRYMHELLAGSGFDAQKVELEGEDHYSWTEMLLADEVVDALNDWKLNPAPCRITFRTWSMRHNRAYWAEINGLDDWGREAEIDVELAEDRGSLNVTSTNVLGLRLSPPASLVAVPGDLEVTWNGTMQQTVVDDGVITLGRQAPSEGLWKRRGLCGPIREVFADRFVFVYGGDRDGESYQKALRAATDWFRFGQGVPDILPAARVTPELMQDANLILYGTIQDNPIMERVAGGLPVTVDGDVFKVGDRSFDASRYGLSVIYPNPLAQNRYVVLNAGLVWGNGLASNHKYDMLPDFIVFSDEVVDDGTDTNRAMAAGFFDQRWKLDEASTWFFPEPEPQAEVQPKVPAFTEPVPE